MLVRVAVQFSRLVAGQSVWMVPGQSVWSGRFQVDPPRRFIRPDRQGGGGGARLSHGYLLYIHGNA